VGHLVFMIAIIIAMMYLSIISILKLKSRPTGTNVEYHSIHSQVNLSITFCKTGNFNTGRDGHQFL